MVAIKVFDTIDKALHANGWEYDPEHERFTDGKCQVDDTRILALVPGLTMGDLAVYVDERHAQRRASVNPK
jgi:hypothetical protein